MDKTKTKRPAYFGQFENLKMERDENGVLEVAMHTDGGPITFTGQAHTDFADAFYQISRDRDNRVVIFTGTGDAWMSEIDFPSLGDVTQPRVWDQVYWEGKKVLQNLLDIEVPVICAVNGPALIHSEYALLSDIILASETAAFQDKVHLSAGIVQGDGLQVVWPHVLGEIRGRYFLWTQQTLSAGEALELGVVNEVLPRNELMPRARDLAAELAALPPLTLRYNRVAFTQRMKRLVQDGVGYGLTLEGISATDLANQNGS